MNILIFNWRDIKNSWAGGSELYIHELAKRWKKAGNTITMLAAQDPFQDLPNEEMIDGVRIIRKGGRLSVYFWLPYIYLSKLRKNTDIIIDIENGIPFFTPLFSLKKKIALVYHVHGKQFFYELSFPLNLVGFILEKYIFPILYQRTPIIAISKSTKDELIKLGFRKSNISIVTPGLQYPAVNKKTRKYKRPTILYLGRIKKYKRLDILIDVFPEILKKVPNARLIVAGWGTEAPQISDIIMKNGFRRNVELLGPVSEKEKRMLLQKSWVMVNPSLHEGWGITVIEANYYGTPAVAFHVPGLSDAIKNNVTGFLCKSNDEFVQKITLLMQKKLLREKMSKKAHTFAKELTWEKASRNSLSLIKHVN